MITLLTGTNSLVIGERLQALRSHYDPSGLNTTVIENASQRLPEVQAACGALGFFGAVRLVIARDLVGGRSSSRRGTRATERDTPALDVLAAVPESTILILVEQVVDSSGERALRKSAPDIQIERHDVPRGRDLVEWSCARARQYDATLDPGSATELLNALFPGNWNAAQRRDDTPPDMYRLDSEIAKLASAAGLNGRITAEFVSALVPGAESQNIWGLTEAISRGEPRAAIQEVERALNQGVAPEALVGQLAGQFEALAALHAAGNAPKLTLVAEVTGVSEGRLNQTARYARRFPPARVRDSLSALRQFDGDAKQGRIDPTEALVSLVARLAAGAL